MSGNVCGNCSNFKPKLGDKFFHCLIARHAGITYGMQVRKDTAACEAFAPLKASPAPSKKIAQPAAPQIRKEPPPRRGLCPWGRTVMIVVVLILLLLVAFGIYSCARARVSQPSPTSTPVATATPTGGLPAPSITPVPVPTIPATLELQVGQSATGGGEYIRVNSVTRTACIPAIIGQWCQPPPGSTYVAVSITIMNGGTSEFTVGEISFVLRDSNGFIYSGKSGLISGGLSSTFGLKMGQSVTDTIYFTVPTDVTGLSVYARLMTGQLVIWVTSL
jgi:hypothetical protein